MDSEAWNERYRSAERVWTGEPNEALVALAPDPPTNRRALALDLGCGEGADALWLASRGWEVLGADWAEVALDRARAQADASGLPARFVRADITDVGALAALSATGTFDLVMLAYIHPEPADRAHLYARLPDLVAPAGHLLVIAHDPEHGTLGRPGPDPRRLMSADDILAALDLPAGFTTEVGTTLTRRRDDVVTAIDSAVLVRRDG
jgi:SAM-dependent methyltransferase